jgi:hypothetical protein
VREGGRTDDKRMMAEEGLRRKGKETEKRRSPSLNAIMEPLSLHSHLLHYY